MVTFISGETGSQKVGGSNPPGSTNKPKVTIPSLQNPSPYHSISPNPYTGLAIPLYRLIEVFFYPAVRLNIPMSPHKLRHSFAISFLRNGANPFELQIALGHSTFGMTRRYTQALGFDDVFKRHVLASPVDRAIR